MDFVRFFTQCSISLDLKMLPEKYKKKVTEQLDVLWRVWSGLGLFSEGPILLTSIEEAFFGLCVFGRYNQRLFDEAVSLLITYPDLILKNKIEYLLRYADETTSNVFAIVCSQMPSTPSGKRLQSTATRTQKDSLVSESSFFLSLKNDISPIGKNIDNNYFRHGWLRNRFSLSLNVPSLSVVASVNPWIRGKLLFGNTNRVDIILSLLIENGTAPDVARRTGCSQKGAWNILNDLVHAGFASSKPILNKREFQLSTEGKKFFSFLQPGDKATTPWREWREIGHYLHHLSALPEDASEMLVVSEEVRVKNIVERL